MRVCARRRENVFRLCSNPRAASCTHVAGPRTLASRTIPAAVCCGLVPLLPAFWAIRAPRRRLGKPRHPFLACPRALPSSESAAIRRRSGQGRCLYDNRERSGEAQDRPDVCYQLVFDHRRTRVLHHCSPPAVVRNVSFGRKCYANPNGRNKRK